MSALDRLLVACSQEISSRAAAMSDARAVGEGAAAFAARLDHAIANPIARPTSTVPVAAHAAALDSGRVAAAAAEAVDEIPWIPSHRMTDGGTEAALAPLNEVRDFGDLIVGLLLLAPGGRYPEHNHPPQELYLPISDDGVWKFGGSGDYARLPDDYLPYNNPFDLHAMVAGESPILAMYVLWP